MRFQRLTDDDAKVVFVVDRIVGPLMDIDSPRLSTRGRADIKLCIVESDEAKVVATRQLRRGLQQCRAENGGFSGCIRSGRVEINQADCEPVQVLRLAEIGTPYR